MKRVLCLVLVLAMLVGFTACKSSQSDTSLKPLTPVGTYEAGNADFYGIQSDLYDYFLSLFGFGNITKSNENGDFSDDEIIQFALVQLSRDGEDITAGLTKRQIDRTTTRFFGQKASKLTGTYLTYDSDKELYFPQNIAFSIGQYMVLKKLTVQEDALCIAEFDRLSTAKAVFPADRGEEELKGDLLNGEYHGNGGDRVRITYHERDTDAYGYYLEILSLEVLDYIN